MLRDKLIKKCKSVDIANIVDIIRENNNINSEEDLYKFYQDISLAKILKIYIEYYGIDSLNDEITSAYAEEAKKEKIKKDLAKQYQQIEKSIANITEIMSETEIGRGLAQKTWSFEFSIDDLYKQANESKSRVEKE